MGARAGAPQRPVVFTTTHPVTATCALRLHLQQREPVWRHARSCTCTQRQTNNPKSNTRMHSRQQPSTVVLPCHLFLTIRQLTPHYTLPSPARQGRSRPNRHTVGPTNGQRPTIRLGAAGTAGASEDAAPVPPPPAPPRARGVRISSTVQHIHHSVCCACAACTAVVHG